MSDRVITPSDGEWPSQLDELGPARPVEQLYVRGLPVAADRRTVAVVGSRRPTAAGVEAAERLTRGLVEAGFSIVSGLALGIDTVAHATALDAGGYSIAVLGCGLDVDYPVRNATLRQRIASAGTILTEYELGTPPNSFNFPERNRIIAGLSAGVVFVEGAERSGGRITALAALDANRAVFAVPGSIRNPMALGPNELIRTSQAALVTDVKHICDELEPDLVWDRPVDLGPIRSPIKLDERESQVLWFLDDAPVAVDAICGALGLKPGEVAIALSRLEVRGLAVRKRSGYAISGGGARLRHGRSRTQVVAPAGS
jgi:DNA processing protein